MKRVLVGRIGIRIDKKRGGGASPRLARFLYYFSPWFFGCVCRRVWVCEESEQTGTRGGRTAWISWAGEIGRRGSGEHADR